MPRRRIAILSTAHIHTKGFIEQLAKHPDGNAVHAVWDDVTDRGTRYAASCGARFVPEMRAVLSDPLVDAFLICAENTRHLPLLEQALPVGKPVMCEKPLVTTSKEAGRVRALLAKHPVPLVCGYFKPFSGEMRAVAAAIQQGRFGTITSIRYRNAHHAAYGRWFDDAAVRWFTDPALSGGGAFMDMGTHAVHLLRSLMGPVTAVTATIGNRCGIYPQVDDHGIALLRFAKPSGSVPLLGVVEASWIHQGGPSGLEIQGTKAALWHEGGRYVIGAPGAAGEPLEATAGRPATVDRLIACLDGKLSAQELADDQAAYLDAVAIMEAAYHSSKNQAWVEIAEARAQGA